MKRRIIAVYLSFVLVCSFVRMADAALPKFDESWKQGVQTDLTEAKKAEVSAKMGTMQIPFIANQGQMDEQVAFYAKTFGGTVFVTRTGEIVYALPKTAEDDQTIAGMALHEELVGGMVQNVTGEEEAITRVGYFKGNDPSQWQSNISTYQYVDLGEVYEGIELTLKAHGNNVEKLFVVRPGTAPETIRLKLRGAQTVIINEAEELEVETALGVVTFTKPIAYQEVAGERIAVEVAYTISGDHYGFKVGKYDNTKELIIDPLLASTLLDMGENYEGFSTTLDGSGNVYVIGRVASSVFPITPGAYDTSHNGEQDAFISKLTSDLSTLLASTFLGGGAMIAVFPSPLTAVGMSMLSGILLQPIFPSPPARMIRVMVAGIMTFLFRSLTAI